MLAASVSLYSGGVSKTVAPVGHLDTVTRESVVRVEKKYWSYPLIENKLKGY